MGMPLDSLTLDEAVARVIQGLAHGRGGAVLTPNVDMLRQYQRSPDLQRAFETTDLLVADGVPLVWASRIQGTPVPQRITGSDMLVARRARRRAAARHSSFSRAGAPAWRSARRTAAARAPGLRAIAPLLGHRARWPPSSRR